ncbi:MAG: DUF975 family protein [Candidatus Cloacimonadaceae bacterium]
MNVGEVRRETRELLAGQWTPLIPINFMYLLILMAPTAIFRGNAAWLGAIISLILGGPMTLGYTKIILKVYHREPYELGQLFDGFKDFGRSLSAYLLMLLYVFLWTLLLIVPGIIAALSYSMVFFLLAENPQLQASEALRQSKEMMVGHKWDLFRLILSFIGWIFLSILSFGIGYLWLESYIYVAYANFYYKIKGQPEEEILQPGEYIIEG